MADGKGRRNQALLSCVSMILFVRLCTAEISGAESIRNRSVWRDLRCITKALRLIFTHGGDRW